AFDRSAWELTAKGRHQRHHDRILASASEASESSRLNRLEIQGGTGIIACGYPASLAEGLGVSLLAVGYAHPLPWKMIRRFIDGHRTVLVAEEPEPLIEMQLRMSPKIRGRLTGHLPLGQLERSDLAGALEMLEGGRREGAYETSQDRGYAGLCDDCPYEPLFQALGRLDAPVAGDAGCAIRAVRAPYLSVDVAYGLGSSVGVASGFRRKGVAVIGDFALAHSGLQGLINAVWRGRSVLVVLLKNDVAAMTGGQGVPDLTRVLEALVPTSHIDLPGGEIEELLLSELGRPGASVVVARGRCPRYS
ncbi:MAG: thiamine pyrophosphate-dependent enzyme, partial [Methanothrix sp.]|nr:thiamine pyrophosphate-dependent enzyme [Methanothrix sp.]